ncbi:hypothetical protein [Actibacterium atlanticum]|nr:hypothetical protein [Actibacterium atlanticum]
MTLDHAALTDTYAARRYFKKFDLITGHLLRVAQEMERDGQITDLEKRLLGGYLKKLSDTFHALSLKYLLTGRDTGQFFGSLSFDAHESGFPVFRELLTMANDAAQAQKHLDQLPTTDALKDQMVQQIVGELTIPTRLQFAMSQRLYYEALQDGDLFWAQNDPSAVFVGDLDPDRRTFLVHWAVYDSQVNLPTLYLMEVEDTGRRPLPKDERRWPEVQAHLMAQSLGSLKLLTIARGFDTDFDDLHPKRLRRFHLGPMHSSAFTHQSGPLHEVLDQANAPAGEDWALAWTLEDLESERVIEERSGWFGSVEREVFALDPFSGRGADTGATRTERAVILPQRAFQVLAERNPPGFRDVRKFVVSPGGRVLSYR